MNSLSNANTHFGLDLYQKLRKSKGNIFFSSLNITSGLSMLLLGARKNTALEIEKVLHLNEVTENAKGSFRTFYPDVRECCALAVLNIHCFNTQGLTITGKAINQIEHIQEDNVTKDAAWLHVTAQLDSTGNVHHQFQKLLTELKKPTDAYGLNIANGLYGEKSFQFLQDYLENTRKFYLASVESADFVNAAEESRKKINSWVESQTNGKIKDLFPRDSLDRSTKLVLASAIWFKGLWARKFNKEYTKEGKFWVNKDTSKPVQMMKQQSSFNLAFLEDEKAKILEMPYKGKELSMFVLLPNEVDGLQKLEDKLTAEKLIEWMSSSNMSQRNVDLCFPRFKVEESYDLKTVLGAMGMKDAFNPQNADLSGMTGGRDLVVSKILHKAYVEVTEEGTEAAAATGIKAVPLSAPIYEKFHCDHPFLYLISHCETKSILFIGRFSSP